MLLVFRDTIFRKYMRMPRDLCLSAHSCGIVHALILLTAPPIGHKSNASASQLCKKYFSEYDRNHMPQGGRSKKINNVDTSKKKFEARIYMSALLIRWCGRG